VELSVYDIIVVSTSGGIDSQGAMDEAYRDCEKQGMCDRLVAVHADLGRFEWDGNVELVKQQCEWYDIPLHVCSRPQGDLLDHVVAKHNANLANTEDTVEVDVVVDGVKTGEKMVLTYAEAAATGYRCPWFGIGNTQYCTGEHKTGQIKKVYTKLMHEWRERTGLTRPCRLLEILGLRADESGRRKQMPAFAERINKSTKTTLHVDQWLPIHHWTKDEAWTRAELNEVPTAHSYHLNGYRDGMPRHSCIFCIYPASTCSGKGRDAILLAARHNPELLDEYCAVEAYTGYSFTPQTSLIEIRKQILNEQLITVEAA
jgi:3'-phosphoadenosine 5'-phosphosulfate sulfotransferase (PAPS reductase)/FAD synthetase